MRRLLAIWLLALIGVACSDDSATVATAAGGAPDVTVRVVGTDTGFQPRSQENVASFRVVAPGGKVFDLPRDPAEFSHTLNLVGLDQSGTFLASNQFVARPLLEWLDRH
ncbi:MAG: hypothetical protein AB1758_20220 [Candidatus Eremiobacterota bacterium]